MNGEEQRKFLASALECAVPVNDESDGQVLMLRLFAARIYAEGAHAAKVKPQLDKLGIPVEVIEAR